jgi:tetratricopeptide (TPR) repeat protein
LKIGGDYDFKLNQFNDASKIYSNIIPHYKDNGLIRFNYGVCFLNLNEKQKACEHFKLSYSFFQTKNDTRKCSIIQSILNSLN